MSNVKISTAHKKSRPEIGRHSSWIKWVASAQSDIARNGQQQDSLLVEYERQPFFIIKLAHRSPQRTVPASSFHYFHSVYNTRSRHPARITSKLALFRVADVPSARDEGVSLWDILGPAPRIGFVSQNSFPQYAIRDKLALFQRPQ